MRHDPTVARARRGTALVLCLSLLLILGSFGSILRLLSHSAYKEVDIVNGHLRAVAVGEAGFASITARLSAAQWADRWFRTGADIQYDVPAAGGTYSYLIRDAQVPATYTDPLTQQTLGSPHQADLLIRATYDRTRVVMFWRLTVPEDSLDSLSRVIPAFFTLPPDTTQTTPAAADELTQQVNDSIQTRTNNVPGFGSVIGPLQGATTAQGVAGALGIGPSGVLDGIPSASGSGPMADNPTRVTAGAGSKNIVPPAPPPPPPPVDPSPPVCTDPCATGTKVNCGGQDLSKQKDLKGCVSTCVIPCLLNLTYMLNHQVQPLCTNADRVRHQLEGLGYPSPDGAPTAQMASLIAEAKVIIDHARTAHLGGQDPCSGCSGGTQSGSSAGGGHGGWWGHGWGGWQTPGHGSGGGGFW